MTPIFELKIKVRDYECDIQGIVNNANYQHYTEHTRNEFIRSRGLAFDELHRRGIDTVVARLEMQFKTPLRPGDEFLSQLLCSQRRHQIRFRTATVAPPRPPIVLESPNHGGCYSKRPSGRL